MTSGTIYFLIWFTAFGPQNMQLQFATPTDCKVTAQNWIAEMQKAEIPVVRQTYLCVEGYAPNGNKTKN